MPTNMTELTTRPDKRELLARLLFNPQNIPFGQAVDLVEAFGFRLVRTNGIYYFFRHRRIPECLPLQSRQGNAVCWQLRQFGAVIEQYGLNFIEE